MEIKDILSELITVATNQLAECGNPENFDLEEMIEVLESYYEELDELGEFYYFEDENEDGWEDEDGDY